MRLIAPIAAVMLALLAACSPPRAPVVLDEEMEVMAEAAAGAADDPACLPGDDGIGGTGCKLD